MSVTPKILASAQQRPIGHTQRRFNGHGVLVLLSTIIGIASTGDPMHHTPWRISSAICSTAHGFCREDRDRLRFTASSSSTALTRGCFRRGINTLKACTKRSRVKLHSGQRQNQGSLVWRRHTANKKTVKHRRFPLPYRPDFALSQPYSTDFDSPKSRGRSTELPVAPRPQNKRGLRTYQQR